MHYREERQLDLNLPLAYVTEFVKTTHVKHNKFEQTIMFAIQPFCTVRFGILEE